VAALKADRASLRDVPRVKVLHRLTFNDFGGNVGVKDRPWAESCDGDRRSALSGLARKLLELLEK